MSIGTGIDALIKLRHLLIDRREQRRWFIRWSVKEALECSPGISWLKARERAAELRAWVTARLAARKDDDAVEESPLVDPKFARLQHVCFYVGVALDHGAGLEFADELLRYADQEFEAAGPFGDAPPSGFGSEKGM